FDRLIWFAGAIKTIGSHESKTRVLGCKLPIPAGDNVHVSYPAGRLIGIHAVASFGAGSFTAGPGCEDSTRSTGLARCSHCPLSRSDARSDARGFHVSSRSNPAPAVAGKESRAEG